MLWVALLLCEIILEVFGLYDSALGMVFIKNNFDMKIIIVLVLYYNLIINMIDCGLKFIVAVWLLIGPKGQLILKCPFGVIVSTKIPMKFVLRISALASKKRLNQKRMKALYFIF